MVYKDEILHHETEFENFDEAIADVQFSDGDLQAMKSVLMTIDSKVPYTDKKWAESFLKDIETTLAKKRVNAGVIK